MQIPYRPKLQVNLYEIVKPKLAVIESGAQAHHFEFKPNIAGLHPSNPAQKKLGKGDLALKNENHTRTEGPAQTAGSLPT